MDSLMLNGKEFVRATKAARDLGYTSDYVGQLARGNHIDAHLVGRSWYVDMKQLSMHKKEKKRISRQKAREQARDALKRYQDQQRKQIEMQESESRLLYQNDTHDLNPPIRSYEKKFITDNYRDKEGITSDIRPKKKLEKLDKSPDRVYLVKVTESQTPPEALQIVAVTTTARVEASSFSQKPHRESKSLNASAEKIPNKTAVAHHNTADFISAPIPSPKEILQTKSLHHSFLRLCSKLTLLSICAFVVFFILSLQSHALWVSKTNDVTTQFIYDSRDVSSFLELKNMIYR